MQEMLEPEPRQRQQKASSIQQQIPLSKEGCISYLLVISFFLILLITITVVFGVTVGVDILALQGMRLLFSKIFLPGSFPDAILTFISSFSSFVGLTFYGLTLLLCVALAIRNYNQIARENIDKPEGLPSRMVRLLQDTAQTILKVITLTCVFIGFSLIVFLLLEVAGLLMPSLVYPIQVFTAFAVAIEYGATLLLSLWYYTRDLLKFFSKFSKQERKMP